MTQPDELKALLQPLRGGDLILESCHDGQGGIPALENGIRYYEERYYDDVPGEARTRPAAWQSLVSRCPAKTFRYALNVRRIREARATPWMCRLPTDKAPGTELSGGAGPRQEQ